MPSSLSASLTVRLIDQATGPAAKLTSTLKELQKLANGLRGGGSGGGKIAGSFKIDGGVTRDLNKLTKALTSYTSAASAANRSPLNLGNIGAQAAGIAATAKSVSQLSRALSTLNTNSGKLTTGAGGNMNWMARQSAQAQGWARQMQASIAQVRAAQRSLQGGGMGGPWSRRGGMGGLPGLPGAGGVPMHPYGHGYRTREAGRAAVVAGADSAGEEFKQQIAGMTPEQTKRLSGLAGDLTAQFPSLSKTQIEETGRDLRNMVPSFDRAMEMLPAMVKFRTSIQATKGMEQGGQEVQGFIKSMDVLGRTEDSNEMIALMKGVSKAVGVEGRQLPLREYLNMARRSKSAGAALSPEFLTGVAPTFMQDMGGDQFGTSLGTLISQVIGNRGTDASMAAQQKLGIRQSYVSKKKGAGQIVDPKMFMTNPYEWAQKYLLPALSKSGVDINDESAVTQQMSQLFSAQTGSNTMGKFITQRAQAERNKQMYAGAQDYEQTAPQARYRDPRMMYEGSKRAAENVVAPVSKNVLEMINPIVNWATDAMNRVGKNASEDPRLSTALSLGGGAAAAVAAYASGKIMRGMATSFGASMLKKAGVGTSGVPNVAPSAVAPTPGGVGSSGVPKVAPVPNVAPSGPGLAARALPMLGKGLNAAFLANALTNVIGSSIEQFGVREASGPGSTAAARRARQDMNERYGMSTGAGGRTMPTPAVKGAIGDAAAATPPPATPTIDPSGITGGKSAIDDVKTSLDAINSTPVSPKLDTSSLGTAESAAQNVKSAFDGLSGISVSPTVDTSSLDAAIVKANELKSILSSIGGLAAGAGSAIGAAAGKAASALATSRGASLQDRPTTG